MDSLKGVKCRNSLVVVDKNSGEPSDATDRLVGVAGWPSVSAGGWSGTFGRRKRKTQTGKGVRNRFRGRAAGLWV